MCPKPALFQGYIDLEIEVSTTINGAFVTVTQGRRPPAARIRPCTTAVREIPRGKSLQIAARSLFLSFTLENQYDPTNSPAWIKYAELESQLQDFNRTRAIFELGVSQRLSMPELLWKAYIDFEIEGGERTYARALYDRLVSRSGNIQAWISYAQFEAEPIPVPRAEREEEEEEEEGTEEKEPKFQAGSPAMAREVFERGYKDLKRQGLKHEVGLLHYSSGFVLMAGFIISVSHCFKCGRRSKTTTARRRTWHASRA
jgi:hypothetical protein